MKTIHKYTLKIKKVNVIYLPEGARILHVGKQKHDICVWAEIDDDMLLHKNGHTFHAINTGKPFPKIAAGCMLSYHATVRFDDDDVIIHVYEEVLAPTDFHQKIFKN